MLTRTSNPGGADLQEARAGRRPRPCGSESPSWSPAGARPFVGESGLSAVGAVVGATRPEAVARARDLMPHQPLLLPGVGAQGGAAGDLHAAFRDHPAGGLDRRRALGDLRLARARRRLAAGSQNRRGRPAPRRGPRVTDGWAADLALAKELARARGRRGARALPPHPRADAQARRELGDRGRPRRRGRDPRAGSPRPGPTTTCSARRAATRPPRAGRPAPAPAPG